MLLSSCVLSIIMHRYAFETVFPMSERKIIIDPMGAVSSLRTKNKECSRKPVDSVLALSPLF